MFRLILIIKYYIYKFFINSCKKELLKKLQIANITQRDKEIIYLALIKLTIKEKYMYNLVKK